MGKMGLDLTLLVWASLVYGAKSENPIYGLLINSPQEKQIIKVSYD